MSEKIDFGTYLKSIRENKKMSINQLAIKSGISNAQISRIENGLRGVPKADTIQKLADALETSFVELMVVAGYWDEDDLLEPIGSGGAGTIKETPSDYANEKEFLSKIDLSDEELTKQFTFEVDGRELTEKELKKLLAFLRVERELE